MKLWVIWVSEYKYAWGDIADAFPTKEDAETDLGFCQYVETPVAGVEVWFDGNMWYRLTEMEVTSAGLVFARGVLDELP